MYQIGDKVVHPMHGAGVIDSIVQRKVAGKVENPSRIPLLRKKEPFGSPPLSAQWLSTMSMTVMIPTGNTQEIGVRPVVSGQEAESLIDAMEVHVSFPKIYPRGSRPKCRRAWDTPPSSTPAVT